MVPGFVFFVFFRCYCFVFLFLGCCVFGALLVFDLVCFFCFFLLGYCFFVFGVFGDCFVLVFVCVAFLIFGGSSVLFCYFYLALYGFCILQGVLAITLYIHPTSNNFLYDAVT